MKKIFLAIAFLYYLPAFSYEFDFKEISSCGIIKDGTERLECFDDAYAKIKEDKKIEVDEYTGMPIEKENYTTKEQYEKLPVLKPKKYIKANLTQKYKLKIKKKAAIITLKDEKNITYDNFNVVVIMLCAPIITKDARMDDEKITEIIVLDKYGKKGMKFQGGTAACQEILEDESARGMNLTQLIAMKTELIY